MNTTSIRALALCALAAALSLPLPAGAAPGTQSPSSKYSAAAFVMTNEAAGNQIIVYGRARDGMLTRLRSEPTRGNGQGVSATTRGMLRLSPGNEYLYAANSGSDSISVFRIESTRLQLLQVIAAGDEPVSLAVSHSLVYSLDGGANPGIRGFRVGSDGRLTALPGSFRALGAGANPGEIRFSPDGQTLLATVQNAGTIDAFPIGADGYAAATPICNATAGSTPFSIAFSQNGTLIVGETNNGAPDSSAVTAYSLNAGTATAIETVPTYQTDVQSIAVHEEFVFAASYAGGNVSSYVLDADGRLTLVNAAEASFGANSRPTNLGFSIDGRYLYQLLRGPGAIGAMHVALNGRLTTVQSVGTELPAGTPLAGMAVY